MKCIFARSMPMLALITATAACGGGEVGSVGSSPPPPGPPTYTKLIDLSGNQTFQTGGVQYNVSPSGLSGGVSQAFGSGVVVNYNAAADSYQLTASDGSTQTFAPADVSGQPAPNVIQFVKVNGATRDQLTLTSPLNNGVSLSYTLVGAWVRSNTSNNTGVGRIALGGVPTVASDMPKTGTAIYNVGAGGSANSGGTVYTLSGNSGAGFSVNFATGAITTNLNLAGVPANGGGSVTQFGTFNGTGTIAANSPGFTGTLTGTSANGLFSGAFFGPQALEMGYAWYLNGDSFSGAGVVTGVRQ